MSFDDQTQTSLCQPNTVLVMPSYLSSVCPWVHTLFVFLLPFFVPSFFLSFWLFFYTVSLSLLLFFPSLPPFSFLPLFLPVFPSTRISSSPSSFYPTSLSFPPSFRSSSFPSLSFLPVMIFLFSSPSSHTS
jgi:hypothetical protein